MTNAEKRERRREAGRRAAQARAAKRAGQVIPPQVEAPRVEPPRTPTVEEIARRADHREEKRRENLRALIEEAQRIRREEDLQRYAYINRFPFSRGKWTAEQIEEARQFLRTFYRPDGTPEPHPVRRRGRWRL